MPSDECGSLATSPIVDSHSIRIPGSFSCDYPLRDGQVAFPGSYFKQLVFRQDCSADPYAKHFQALLFTN